MGAISGSQSFFLVEFINDDFACSCPTSEDFDVDFLVIGILCGEDVHELAGVAVNEGKPG